MDILALGDYSSFTGFGEVMQGIFHNLPDSWDITIVGVSYNPHVEIGNIPDNINVIDAKDQNNDVFGRKRFIKIMRSDSFTYDAVWLLQDSFILDADIRFSDERIPFIEVVKKVADKRNAKVISYIPMDQPHPYIEWFDTVLKNSDQMVYYLDWARDNADYYSDLDHKGEADVIHHGVNRDVYYPLNEMQTIEIRNQMGLNNDEFTILFGGANQRRKNIPHDVLGAFIKLYKQTDKDVRLFLKTDPNRGVGNSGEGWNLGKITSQLCDEFNIPERAIQYVGVEEGYLPERKINHLYNAVDAIYNPGCEGWGLWVVEAMSARTPTIVGDHASLSEIGDYGRSIQVSTNDSLQDRIWYTDDWEVYRSQINLDSFVDKTKNLIEMSDGEKNKMLDKAEDSAYTKDWKSIANKWRELFQRVINE